MKRILHFGPGNFFRAHLAEYTQDAGGWAITGVSLRTATVRDGLAAQNFAYTLAIQGIGYKKISVIDRVLVAAEEPELVLEELTDPDVHIISATVTEKGYHLNSNGSLNLDDPEIRHDLEGDTPKTLIGFLAQGLAKRSTPVTVMSCDNRNANGDVLRDAVQSFATAAGLSIDCEVSFPNAMVDRITPATTDDLRTETQDPMAVPCEPFKEGVIDDLFSADRPDWPGAQIVSDVGPHETRKLRMLNGAHSYLAYAGTLAGHEFVHQAIADPSLREMAAALMQEARETLPEDIQDQAAEYAKSLIERFENPLIRHRLRQIAMDGSEKLPYRILDTMRDRIASHEQSPALMSALVAWLDFCRSETAAGRSLQDPLGTELAKAANDPDSKKSLLEMIGGADLAHLIAE